MTRAAPEAGTREHMQGRVGERITACSHQSAPGSWLASALAARAEARKRPASAPVSVSCPAVKAADRAAYALGVQNVQEYALLSVRIYGG